MVGNVLLDKLIILALCTIVYIQQTADIYVVVPVICALAAGTYASYTDRVLVKLFIFLIYCSFCLFYPHLLYFLPLICYDLWILRQWYFVLAVLVPLSAEWMVLSTETSLLLIFIIALS